MYIIIPGVVFTALKIHLLQYRGHYSEVLIMEKCQPGAMGYERFKSRKYSTLERKSDRTLNTLQAPPPKG